MSPKSAGEVVDHRAGISLAGRGFGRTSLPPALLDAAELNFELPSLPGMAAVGILSLGSAASYSAPHVRASRKCLRAQTSELEHAAADELHHDEDRHAYEEVMASIGGLWSS